jgi:hypothetical protein
MPDRATNPTPYPDVNALIDRLLADVRTAVGPHFVGLYLHGSLAAGDFDPARSDIDFVVVTSEALPADVINALAAMHERIAASCLKWVTNYEGSYIPERAIRRYDPDASLHPVIRVDGSFGMDEHGSEYQAYAILTMCRARFTLACGAIASKPQAAAWARANLDPRWAGLIDRAVSWRHGVELDCFEGALAFIRETLP